MLSSSHAQHPAASPALAHCSIWKRCCFLNLESLLTHFHIEETQLSSICRKRMEGGAKTELLALLYCSQRKEKRWNGRGSETLQLLLRGLQREPLIPRGGIKGSTLHTCFSWQAMEKDSRFWQLEAGTRNRP